jgi:predicted esterase
MKNALILFLLILSVSFLGMAQETNEIPYSSITRDPNFKNILVTSEDEAYQLKYIETKPGNDWDKADYDDSAWKTGAAPFGDLSKHANTEWKSSDLWVRRTFELADKNLKSLCLKVRLDDNVEVYVNGTLAYTRTGWTNSFLYIALADSVLKSLKTGKNVLAIHIVNTWGEGWFDAGLYSDIKDKTGTNITQQYPTDNPYKTKYHLKSDWTDCFQWEKVTDASKIPGLIDGDRKVNLALLNVTMNMISKQGGGVLYFPAGKYNFINDVELYSGVIIRGANPSSTDAKASNFNPPTVFTFPPYIPSFEKDGTPDSTSFKRIHTGGTIKDRFGLVNIDINRAMIDWGGWAHDNILLFGVRINNVARIVRPPLVNKEKQGWQRYPDNTIFSVWMRARNKATIANCRIGDSSTDDFAMPNFMTNEGYVFKEDTVKFNFGAHPCIMLEADVDNPTNLKIADNYLKSGSKIKIDLRNNKNNKIVSENNQLESVTIPAPLVIDWGTLYSKSIQDKTTKAFTSELFINSNDTLSYKILKPINYDPHKKYPFVLFLHGNGEMAKDQNILKHFAYIFTSDEVRNKYPFFVVVPHIHENTYKNIQLTLKLVDHLVDTYSTDKKQMFIAGLSTGAAAVWTILLTHPKLFNNAIQISAYKSFSAEQIKKLRKIRFFISSGTLDWSIPIQYSRVMISQLKAAKIDVHSYEYEIGHDSWLPLCVDDAFLSLLFKTNIQKDNAKPELTSRNIK